MDKYIDLVVCKLYDDDFPVVYRAPAWSYLKEGDRVIVESPYAGEVEAIVERSYTTAKSSEELEFILVSSGVSMPLKRVLKQIIYKDFDYKEDEECIH